MGPLLNVAGDVVIQDMVMAEALNAFFTSLLIGKIGLQESQILENNGKVRSKEDTLSGGGKPESSP